MTYMTRTNTYEPPRMEVLTFAEDLPLLIESYVSNGGIDPLYDEDYTW